MRSLYRGARGLGATRVQSDGDDLEVMVFELFA
jgi:hypothetical protein